MNDHSDFKWRYYQSEIIILNVCWYLRYALGYRDLEEMMCERGLSVDLTTIYRWVQSYAPEIDQRLRPYMKQINHSWRVDEAYIKVRGKWMHFYCALDLNWENARFSFESDKKSSSCQAILQKSIEWVNGHNAKSDQCR